MLWPEEDQDSAYRQLGAGWNALYARLFGGLYMYTRRSCLITGKHLGHTRVREQGQKVDDKGGSYQERLRPDDETLGDVMKSAGYVTGTIGKWGVGIPGTEGVPYKGGFAEPTT